MLLWFASVAATHTHTHTESGEAINLRMNAQKEAGMQRYDKKANV